MMKLLFSGNVAFTALGRDRYSGISEEVSWPQNNKSKNIKNKRLIPLHSFYPKRVRGAVRNSLYLNLQSCFT